MAARCSTAFIPCDVSRASNLRDELKKLIELHVEDVPVDAVVVAQYKKEDVNDPRVVVMVSTRDFDVVSGQHVDFRDVIIGVGVIGARPAFEGYSLDKPSQLKQEVEAADKLDGLFEKVTALWTPWTDETDNIAPLANVDVAEHRFREVNQNAAIDFDLYRDAGIWLSTIFLTYRDTKDE